MMGKTKSTKKAAPKTRKPAKAAADAPDAKAPREDLCVFAFRLSTLIENRRNLDFWAATCGHASP
jgi:hypothetical protein